MLALRRGTVVEAGERLVVEVDGERRRAWADEALVGPCEVGDDVVVNVAAVELGLGSGGFDIVHVNLTRGLSGSGAEGAHVMKLNYTSLQHAVRPVSEGEVESDAASGGTGGSGTEGSDPGGSDPAAARSGSPPQAGGGRRVGVFFLHGQLAPVCWALGQAAPGARVGYVQTAGGALPGAFSRVVRDLRERGLLAAHVTAGPAYGGEQEAITTAEAIDHGLRAAGWDVALCGPGPGILGSASRLGHGGLAALDTAHTALALGHATVVVPRMSEGDPRPRHRGLSHHTQTVLDLLLAPVVLAAPAGEQLDPGRHEPRSAAADLDGYAASGLPARTMGRALDEDRLFFAAALAGGGVLGAMVRSP